MLKFAGLFGALTIFALSQAGAQDQAAEQSYVAPDCVKPDSTLIKPQWIYVNGAYMPDNSRVARYNRQAKAFDDCMHAYIDRANGTIARIREKANSDIKQIPDTANSAIKAAEARVHDAVSETNAVSAEEADAVAKASAKTSR